MTTEPEVAWQASLLDGAAPDVDETYAGLTRIQLDALTWLDHVPGWVSGSDDLFAHLLAGTDWRQRSRHMYGTRVEEPRLTSLWRASCAQPLEPPLLERMRRLLSGRYGMEFDSVGLNLYRDGHDSVAWHRDRIAREIAEPVVAIVSVGEPRTFRLRPLPGPTGSPGVNVGTGASAAGGRRASSILLGRGDLLVTGGAFQRQWQHAVPKVASAGPRISVTFRRRLDPSAYPDSSRTNA